MSEKVWNGSEWIELGGGSGVAELPIFGLPSLSAPGHLTTTGGTSHTPGVWTHLTAPTGLSSAINGMILFATAVTNTSAANSSKIIEFGVGAAGSETVVASVTSGYAAANRHWFIPLSLPAGTDLSFRHRGAQTANSRTFYYALCPRDGLAPFGPIEVYGIDTATSRGVTIPGDGSWAEMTAASDNDVSVLCYSIQGNGLTSMTAKEAQVEIGIGPIGSEVALDGIGFRYQCSTSEQFTVMVPTMNYLNEIIPAGTRICARQTATSQAIDLVVLAAGPA